MTANKANYLKALFQKRPKTILCLALCILTIAAYAPVRHHEFINFDDGGYVYDNTHVQSGLNPDSIKWAFTIVKSDEKAYWHPVTWLSHMLDCQLFGVDPGWHHLSNLFYHLANVLLLFLVLLRMTGTIWQSAFAAALFALHPVNVDSVAWIAERKNLLSTTFWMLTMLAYASYAARPAFWRYLTVVAIFALGLMAKPMLVTLPCALLLLDFWPLCRFQWLRDNWLDKDALPSPPYPVFPTASVSRLIMEKLPLLLLSFGAIWISFISLQKNSQILNSLMQPLSLRIANALVSYLHYLWQIIWPANLAVFYPFPKAIPIWQPISTTLALIIITWLTIHSSRKKPYLATGWFWYIGTLTPVIGIIQGGLWPQIANRWAYVPYVGLFIILAWGIPDICSRFRLKRAIPASLAMMILAILFTITGIQLKYWQNTRTLFQHALNVTKNNVIAHLQIGDFLSKKGDHANAMEHFKKALSIDPDYSDTLEAVAGEYAFLKNYDQALSCYQKALLFKPSSDKLFNAIGDIYMKMGDYHQAIANILEAASIVPDSPETDNHLGLAYYFAGQMEPARQSLNQAVALKPDFAEAYYNLGLVDLKSGNMPMSLKEFQKAAVLKPDYAEAHYNMGLIDLKSGDRPTALKEFQKATELNPDYSEAHNSLGEILFQAGNLPEALRHFEQVVRLSPREVSAYYNIGVILYMQQQMTEAAHYFQQALDIDPNYEKAKAALQLTRQGAGFIPAR